MPTSAPRVAYLVCATPRSGSTLLCETLRATGIAGVPLEHFEVLRRSGRPRQPREYLEGAADRSAVALLPELAPPRPDREPSEAWWRRVLRQGRSANGVWGGKLMWSHVPELLDRAHDLDDLADAGLDAVLRRLLGDRLLLVHVARADKVAQAVSLWRAVQTQAWRAGGPERGGGAQYAFGAIDHLVAQLEQQDAAWRSWFARSARRPLAISYDELAADVAAPVRRVLAALDLPDRAIPQPATARQADARSEAWARRYRAERLTRRARSG